MSFKKIAKYVLVAGMVGALAVAPVSAVIAAASAEEKSAEQIAEEARIEEVERQTEEYIAEATSAEHKTVAGVKSSVDGFYTAKNVNGVAVAPAASNSASFVKVTDTDKKKSSAAVAVADAAAASIGGVVGPCINVTYGQMSGSTYTPSGVGSAGTISIGLPGNFKTDGATYSVVAIYAGGQYTILDNVSTDPNVVKVNAPEAPSADVMYAVIKR